MTDDEVAMIAARFFIDEFENDPTAVAEWVESANLNVEEFITHAIKLAQK